MAIYVSGQKYESVIMEAVASKDGYFWHASIKNPRFCNDIHVLDRSTFSTNCMKGKAFDFPYMVKRRRGWKPISSQTTFT